MNEIYFFNAAKLAVKTIINIASVYPKPGLITPLDNSALDGTDYPTLIDGAMSLFQCFVNFASIGGDTESLKPSETFSLIKNSARVSFNDVLRATRGKISLKGNIFCLGLFMASAGRLIAQKRILTPSAIILTASSFVQGIIARELWPLETNSEGKNLTAGQRAYISYGLEGCRGEAEHGFPETLKAIEILRKLDATHGHLTLREKLTHALINIMAENNDTSIAAHNGISELMRVQSEAKKVLEHGGMLSQDGIEEVFELDKKLRTRGAAPNGSAVILANALFIPELAKMKLTRSGYDE